MTSELEQLQTWCDLKCGVPPENVTNDLLKELIGWHLHPVIVKELLKKSTPVQLVIEGNVLGPKGHAVALFRERILQLRVAFQGSGEPIVQAKQFEDDKASCNELKAGECSSNKEQYAVTKAEFIEPVKGVSAELIPGSMDWALLPLALCSWGAMLAAATVVGWV